MREVFIITTGTSLFSSASWEGEAFQDLLMENNLWDDYQKYFLNKNDPRDPEKPGPFFIPELRRQNGERVELFFKKHIDKDNAKDWVKFIAPCEGRNEQYAKRYSAEVTTLLSLSRWEDKTINDLLDHNPVKIVCDSSIAEGSTRHSAAHIEQIICSFCEDPHRLQLEVKDIPGFSSKNPDELEDALECFGKMIKEELRDTEKYIRLILTGGYKVYSMVAASYIGITLETIYMHEAADVIFKYRLRNGNHEMIVNEKVVTV